MFKDDKLKELIEKAQILLTRLVQRFDKYDGNELKLKNIELKIAAEKLNDELLNIVSVEHRLQTSKEMVIVDDIVFQLSIYNDICDGYLDGL